LGAGEEERIAKASTAGAKSVMNFLEGGYQFEMKADIPMSTQQREEARKKKIKDEEDAVMMKKNAALLGKPSSKKKGKQLALGSKSGSDDTMVMFACGEMKAKWLCIEALGLHSERGGCASRHSTASRAPMD
jgi:hypothetical protein